MHNNPAAAHDQNKVQIEPRPGNGKFCLDARNDKNGNGTLVFTYQCHGGANQKWIEKPMQGGTISFIGLDGKCLDVRGGDTRKDGAPLQLWQCHDGGNQRFKLDSDGRIHEAATGKCIVAAGVRDGGAVVLDDCKNAPEEQFIIR